MLLSKGADNAIVDYVKEGNDDLDYVIEVHLAQGLRTLGTEAYIG